MNILTSMDKFNKSIFKLLIWVFANSYFEFISFCNFAFKHFSDIHDFVIFKIFTEWSNRWIICFRFYIIGTFPVAGEINNVTACASDYNTDCCTSSYDIQVKNCSGYYVYNLVPAKFCPQAYCFGKQFILQTKYSS